MGRGPSYSLEDFADRVANYLLSFTEPVRTEQIIKEVRGTDTRVADGLLWLALNQKVKVKTDKNYVYWEIKKSSVEGA